MSRAIATVVLTVLMLFAAPIDAQESNVPDYQAWDRVATEAEDIAEGSDSSPQQLAEARARIVEWRGQFQQAQNINSGRISTVRDQLEALGAAPAEGATEPEEVASRRAELQQQLSTLQAPRLAAVEAFSRADAIVRQIDEATSDRQADELAQLSPSPLLPTSWAKTASEALRLVEGVGTEIGQLADRDVWSHLRPRLPQIGAYLLAALVLLGFGRHWVQSLPSRLSARASDHSRAVVAFIVSLGQIAIPMIGLYLAISAVRATGLAGPWTTPFLDALPVAGVILFGGHWLSRQLFPRMAVAYDTLDMEAGPRRMARRMLNVIAVMFALHHVLSRAALPRAGLYERLGDEVVRVPLDIDEAAVSVGHFVILLLAGAALFRLGTSLRRLRTATEGHRAAYRQTVLRVAGLLVRIVVVVAVMMGAVGFINFANMLMWPTILTLGLVFVLILLQDFTADLFNMMMRGREGAREALAPLLIGFMLVLASTPLFLMIWGARGPELVEYWLRFEGGVSLGGITISPGGLLTLLIVFALGYALTRALQSVMRGTVLPKTSLDAGGQNAVVSGLGYVGIAIAGFLAVTSAGIDLSSLAIVAGALSLGIGFGLQNIVSNFVSGIILLIERPVSVGDWISAGGQQGIVKRISVRSTQVETFDRTEVIVPNSDLISQPVVNWTRHNKVGRIIIPVGVAYGSDTRKVERILREIIESQPTVTIDPAPAVLFRAFGADSLEFEIRAVLADVTGGLGVTSEVCHQIAERFALEGIEIPFAQRDIWLRNPEALTGRAPAAAQPAPPSEPHEAARPAEHDPRVIFDGDPDAEAGPDDMGDGGSADR